MTSWINKQTETVVSQFNQSMDTYYPESMRYTKDPVVYLNQVMTETNLYEAVQVVDWDSYLPRKGSLLDLGGGIGWLSAYLSRMDCVDHIIFLDSCKHYVDNMLPNVFQQMSGIMDKVTPVEGLFYPLLLDDDSIETVIVSASLHHVDNMEVVLKEIYRVLKPGGRLLILNEIPYSTGLFLLIYVRMMVKLLGCVAFKQYRPVSQNVSASCILNDPYLGDRVYPLWFLNNVIKASGFTNTVKIDSGYSIMKSKRRFGPVHMLSHFVCQKN